MKRIILLLTVFFCLQLTYSQPGQLDPLFWTNGIVKSDLGSRFNYDALGKSVLVSSDGSIFILTELTGQTFILVQKANGTIDSSYGLNGFSVPVEIQGTAAQIQSAEKYW